MATVGSAIVAIIWKQPFLRSSAIVCDLRSAIYDRLQSYGNQCLPIILSVRKSEKQSIPVKTHKNSKSSKPSMHNVVSAGTNLGNKHGFLGAYWPC